jgi:hypothetical protein
MINSFEIKLREIYSALKNPLLVWCWKRNGKPIPPPQLIKKLLIDEVRKVSGYAVFIETGTYRGDMIKAHLKNFQKVYSIELSKALWAQAQKRFEKIKHVTILQGDSSYVLSDLLEKVDEPAIFWLDGHYSGGVTALGELECPIYKELDAIFRSKVKCNAVLIDDARCFIGKNDYPTLRELISYVEQRAENYHHCLVGDVLIFLPNEVALPDLKFYVEA